MNRRKFHSLLDRIQLDDHSDELVRINASERLVRKLVGMPTSPQDPQEDTGVLIALRYADPEAYAVWMGFLAYQQSPKMDDDYVLLSTLVAKSHTLAMTFLEEFPVTVIKVPLEAATA